MSEAGRSVEIPRELSEVIEHIRDNFAEGRSQIDKTTRRLCFAGLHPGRHDMEEEEETHRRRDLRSYVSASNFRRFEETAAMHSPNCQLAAYRYVRSVALENRTLAMFEELFAIGSTQSVLLNTTPREWAFAQTRAITIDTPFLSKVWVKMVCDDSTGISDFHLERRIFWPDWRAPLFMTMKPFGRQPEQKSKFWDRHDSEMTAFLLEQCATNDNQLLESKMKSLAGALTLQELKRHPLIKSEPTEPFVAARQISGACEERACERLEFEASEDYRSIQIAGVAYTLTARQAKIVSILHEAYLSGRCDVSEARLLASVDSESSRVRNLFRTSPLRDKFVCHGARRGTYRLSLGADQALPSATESSHKLGE